MSENFDFQVVLNLYYTNLQHKDWAMLHLREQGVYRCRNDLTLLDCCAEAQWVKRYDTGAKHALQTLATTYPAEVANWFRC